MQDITGRIAIDRGPAEVFAFLGDIRNMPHYLPTVRRVTPLGPDRVAVEGEAGGHAYRDEGWLRVEDEIHRMRWGVEGRAAYQGELRVHAVGGRAEVELRLTPGDAHHASGEAMQAALQRCLVAIKAACEAEAGAAAAKDTTRSAEDLPDSRVFGHSATLNPDI